MSDINDNVKTPSIDQLSKDSRNIYYKEHEFENKLQAIKNEVDALLDKSENTTSILYILLREVKDLLFNPHEDLKNEIIYYVFYYIELIINHLIEVDSAYERIYQKILADIEIINNNLRDRVKIYDVPSSYAAEMKRIITEIFGYKSPYVKKRNDLSPNDVWTVKNRNAVMLLRDMDMGSRMETFPIVLDPHISQKEYVKLFSFTPNINVQNEPIFLAELIINGDLYAFKGYLKSETLDRNGKRGAVFDAEYGVSFELPLSFKVFYDDDNNKIIVLFKYDETPDKLITVLKMDFSIHLLVGSDLVIEERNTIFTEQPA
jgi:hypothetical protein